MRGARPARPLGSRALALFAATIALLGATAAVAAAELAASGNLFVTFSGGITPNALPRHESAPITIRVAGKVRTLSGETPPSLRRIEIALNRNGQLDTVGLPSCPEQQLEGLSSAGARAACGDALVGSGTYRARSTFPEQSRSPTNGKILAFNSTVHGQTAILAHIYGTKPVSSTNIIVFHIRRPSHGPFGTVLAGSVPPGLTRWGYLKQISLRLHRTYEFHGRLHSYLSAPCTAPPGLSQASFRFAFASMTFADGRTLSATLTRSCKVRG